MMLSGIAPLVREGDQFRAEFTLRNTTDQAMDVLAQGRVDGLSAPLAPQALSLAPSQPQVIGWEITAPVGVQALRYEVEAASSGGVTDRIRVVQQVQPIVPIRTLQATISQWQEHIPQLVQRSAEAFPERGGVHLLVRSSMVQSLDGVRDWMRRYPYSCLEQQISRAVALRDQGQWELIAAGLPSNLDSDRLLKSFPGMDQGSEVLTSYALSILHETGWQIPTDIRERRLQGLQHFVEGAIGRRPPFAAIDLSLRKLAAVEALSRYTTVKPQVLSSITIEPNLWPTSALLDWWNVLHRVPGIRNQASRLREVEQIVRSRLNLQGRSLGFSSERFDGLWWLMTSADTNAVRLLLLTRTQPAFTERAFDGFRAYYDCVPKGSLSVEYTLRLNQSGRFNLPTTRVEALYAPEMFGELPNDVIEVQP